MSSEQNVPEVLEHQGPPPRPPEQTGGQIGQSRLLPGCNARHTRMAWGSPRAAAAAAASARTSRRRGQQVHNRGAGQFVGDLQAGGPGFCRAPSARPQNPQPGPPQQPAGGGPSTKRWKKKFRDRDRQRAPENPGNQAGQTDSAMAMAAGYRDGIRHQPGNSAGRFKRKGKQRERGPRSFVGPMDHSYRAVNGNFADAPPSTIEAHGNYQGPAAGADAAMSATRSPSTTPLAARFPSRKTRQPRSSSSSKTSSSTPKSPRLRANSGVKVAFIKNDKDAIAELTDGEEADRPGLIVFDLNNANAKPLTLIPKLKAKLKKSTSIIGFLSHLQGELRPRQSRRVATPSCRAPPSPRTCPTCCAVTASKKRKRKLQPVRTTAAVNSLYELAF